MAINNKTLATVDGLLTDITTTEAEFQTGLTDVATEVDRIETSIFGSGQTVAISLDSIRGLDADVLPADISLLGGLSSAPTSLTTEILQQLSGLNTSSTIETRLQDALQQDDLIGGDGLNTVTTTGASPTVTLSVDIDTTAPESGGLRVDATGLEHYTPSTVAGDTADADRQLLSGMDFDDLGHATAIRTKTFDSGDFTDASGVISLNTGSNGARALLNAGQVDSTDGLDYNSSTGTFSHHDTSEVSDVTEANLTYLSGLTFDTYGHVLTTDTQTVAAGEGIDISATGEISAEIATEGSAGTNRGISSFDSIDFNVTDGHVTLNETQRDTETRQAISAGNGLAYVESTGVFSHADTSTATDLTRPTYVNAGDITVVTGFDFDTYGHVVTTPTTQTLTDGDNIVFTATNANSMELSVPRASTTTRGAAQFNDNHFDVNSNGLVQLDTSRVGLNIDDHTVALSKLPNFSGTGLLGSNDAGATEVEPLSVANVLSLLQLNPGNGLSINAADNTINVNNLNFANNYVFDTVTARNTGTIGSTTITWHPGDIAITTAAPTEVWVYVNPSEQTGAVVDSDFAEVTLDPTNLSVTGRSATGLTLASSTGSDAAIPTATTSLAGLQSATDKTKLDSVEANANNYSFNISAAGTTGTGTISDNQTLGFTHSGAATVTRSGDNINVNAVNTTYAAGNGLNLNGTTFSHTDTSSQSSVNNTGTTVIQDVTLDTYGHITGLGSVTLTDTDTTYSVGTGLSANGTVFSHSDTSNQSSVNNSGRTYIQDITLDTFGHITGISSATETVTNTTYSAGAGVDLNGTVFSHTDTSSQGSVNNSGRAVIQDITLDTYGHITAINSATLADTDTTYQLDATAITGGARLNLDSTGTDDFINVIGGTNISVTRNSNDQITIASTGGGSSIDVGTTLPTSPSEGDAFYYCGAEDGDQARLYIFVNSNWVDAAPGIAASSSGGSDVGNWQTSFGADSTIVSAGNSFSGTLFTASATGNGTWGILTTGRNTTSRAVNITTTDSNTWGYFTGDGTYLTGGGTLISQGSFSGGTASRNAWVYLAPGDSLVFGFRFDGASYRYIEL